MGLYLKVKAPQTPETGNVIVVVVGVHADFKHYCVLRNYIERYRNGFLFKKNI